MYFNATLYTYVYGVTEVICGNCDELNSEPSMPGGALVGATLGDRWGLIHQPYGVDLDRFAFLDTVTQTPQGFTFSSNEVAWFYLQSDRAPAEMFGLLSATSRSSGLPGQPPDLVYTMSMDAYVPSPIPEPGTLVLVTTGLAGALIRRRYQKQRGTTT